MTSTNQRMPANGPTNSQPIQVEPFSSFAINQVQNFNIILAANYKPTDLIVTISHQILGLIDRQLQWAEVQDGTNQNCSVSFRAPIVGVYTIEVELTSRPTRIQFQAKAYDLSKVLIHKSSTKCRVGESYELSVDASDAGEGQLEIAVNEGEIPNQVQVLDNGKCIVNFVPEENIPHVVDIKFNGHNVNGCPFVVEIEDSNGVQSQTTSNSNHSVTRNAQKMTQETNELPPILVRDDRVLVNSRASFAIENLKAPDENRNFSDLLLILDPENQAVSYKTTITETKTSKSVTFEFKPSIVGDYAIELNSKSAITQLLPVDLIEQFPFPLKVFDHKKVIVSDVTDGVIGHPVYFFIDASQAGSGNLEIRVSSRTRNVPNYPQSEANAKIRVNFTPTEAVDHSIDVKFNGIPVQGNPFLVRVAQYPQARLPISSKDKLKYVPIDEFTTFFVDYIGSKDNKNLPIHELTDKSCQVYILKPDSNYAKLSTVQFKMDKDDETNKQIARFKVTFKATKIGPHKFFIVVNNELLPNSPIISNVYNINEVKVYFGENQEAQSSAAVGTNKRPVGRLNKPVCFTVDASRAGEGTLALAVVSTLSQNPVQTDVKVSELGHGLYNLTFIPLEFATHSIDMSFNERVAPNSPFMVDVLDEEGKSSADLGSSTNDIEPRMVQNFAAMSLGGAKLSSTKSGAKQGKLQSKGPTANKKSLAYGLVNASNIVYLETGVLDSGKNSVSLVGPTGEKVPFKLGKGVPGAGEPRKPFIEYRPTSIGTHTINVLEGDKILRQYLVEICDPNSVKIVNLKRGDKFTLGKPITFTIDSQDSGQIQLDSITILGPSSANGGTSKHQQAAASAESSILSRIKSISGSSSNVQAPGSPLEYSISKLTDHRQEVKFVPSSLGRHTIDVRCLGQSVDGSPIEIEVLKSLTVEPADGRHSEQARANGRVGPISKEDELRNSIVVHGVSLKCSPVNSTGAFIIETSRQAQARDFDVLITDPGNSLVDVQCYLQQDGNLLAEWTPRRVGTHKIEVYYKDDPVPGSPFVSESFDPSSVILENIKSTVCTVNDKIEFKINRKDAGYGELDVAINSPLGKDLPIEVTPLAEDQDGELGELVSFKPTVAGKYKMSITFAGYEVPKSPITFIVKEATNLNGNGNLNGKPAGQVRLSGTGLKCAEINRSAQFLVESSNDGELKLRIECGDREIVPKIEKRFTGEQACCYSVKYKPTEVGYTSISLYWDGIAMEGSPLSVPTNDLGKITLLQETGKPVAASPSSGGQRLSVHYEPHRVRDILVDTSGCGPGSLVAEAYCRANPVIKFSVPIEQIASGRYRLLFSCPPQHADQLARGLSMKEISVEATYLVRFFYNNLVVPETLVSVLISPTVGGHGSGVERIETTKRLASSKGHDEQLVDCPVVALRGHGLADARCDEDAEFTIDGKDAGPGKPEVRFTALSTATNNEDQPIEVRVEELDRRCYRVVYKPQVAGTYSLNVLWGGKQVAGCPITVSVLDQCEPDKVVCTGEGLKGGVLGDEIKVLIDTRRAGAGELTAMCTGPQKVAFCELLDRGDGTFILYIKPQESGRQTLTVKYGGQHIPKSPFTIKVSGKPDPSKVRVHGPGVEHGVLSLYQSRFVCDTRGAGAGQLTVRIRGPKGAFRMETQRESQRDRTILCKYDPTEPGDYRIEIKWSGRHVPGSPFSIMIFDTQEELNRYLAGGQLAHKQASLGTATLYSNNNNRQAHPSVVHQPQQQVPYANSVLSDYGHHPSYPIQRPPFRLQ